MPYNSILPGLKYYLLLADVVSSLAFAVFFSVDCVCFSLLVSSSDGMAGWTLVSVFDVGLSIERRRITRSEQLDHDS